MIMITTDLYWISMAIITRLVWGNEQNWATSFQADFSTVGFTLIVWPLLEDFTKPPVEDYGGNRFANIASNSWSVAMQVLGFYMNIASLPAVPSPFMEKPGNKDGYFSGGYTVKRYGSRWGRHVDAIQIEFPNGLRSQLAKKNKCLRKMRNKVVLAILCFFKTNYHYSPQSSGLWPWRTTNPKIKTFNEFTKKCPHTPEIDTDLRKRNLDRQI